MKKDYQVASRSDRRALAEFLSKEGQLLLPMLELVELAELAVDELIDVAGRATIEAVLTLSAQQLAGPKQPGKKRSHGAGTGREAIGWYGSQDGVVSLAERKLRVGKARLRCKGKGQGGEVEIPAYQAMQTNSRLGQRILEILMHGVSTRNYRKVLPEMAETVGVSKSRVSREFVDASEKTLRELAERRFDKKDILIVYLDGLVFGEQHVIAAIGVDSKGYKHVLGLRDGASENATVCKALLADLVERGVRPGRRRLFVIDGSKALRAAIDAVYGKDNPVQRCRNHKRKNVLDHVSDPLKDTVKATMNAAYRLDADQGMARLEKLAKMLEKEHPSASGQFVCPIQLFDDGTFSGAGCRASPRRPPSRPMPKVANTCRRTQPSQTQPAFAHQLPRCSPRGKKPFSFWFAGERPVMRPPAPVPSTAVDKHGHHVTSPRPSPGSSA